MSSEIIICKNVAVGDLTQSLHAINNKDKNIIIYTFKLELFFLNYE